MKTYGDLIVSGGEAFNAYFDRESRIVTTDIDTKFTPVIRINKTHIVTSHDPKLFGYLQIIKLLFWNKLGQLVIRLNAIVCKRIKQLVISSTIGKLLGISFSNKSHLTRRYTLIKKNKETSVLIDIELFAIDLQLKYFIPSYKKIKIHNIGGLLDIAFMRSNEFGFEATYTKDSGMNVRNPITKVTRYNKRILYASKKFLIEDIYYLQKFNLRPKKIKKDQQRMYSFCKNVLKVKNIKSTDTLESIYKKSITKVKHVSTTLLNRPIFNKRVIKKVSNIDPYKYKNVTTAQDVVKIVKQLYYGLKGQNGLTIPGYSPTYSKYRFIANNGKWIINNNPSYIHNEANYRPNNLPKKNPVNIRYSNILYGYSPARNYWLPKKLVYQSAQIPLVQLV